MKLHSRIHKLKSVNAFVKREDELFYGSKIRKYLSLIPTLKNKKTILIGSLNSNNILIGSQLLIQNDKIPILFVKGNEIVGNSIQTSLLVPKSNIHFIKREDWRNVNSIINEFVSNHYNEGFDIIQEGASNIESIAGSMTLADDIIKNEEENNLKFKNVFVDCGTGTTAISLILRMSQLKRNDLKVHVVQMENSLSFSVELNRIRNELKLDLDLIPYEVYRPNSLSSFGTTNQELFKFIQQFARKEGILLDPIYNAKLFLKSSEIINSINESHSLIIHSGGNLNGFEKQIMNVIQH
jgi:1-aminocyclopropane-1-carboxylate deaminase